MRRIAIAQPRLARTVSRRRRLWRLVFLGILLVVFASYVSPIRTYIEKTRQIEAEKLVTEQLREHKDGLVREKEQLHNNTYVEQVARRDLGLVRPGEQSYVVKGLDRDEMAQSAAPEMASASGTDASASVIDRARDWVFGLLH